MQIEVMIQGECRRVVSLRTSGCAPTYNDVATQLFRYRASEDVPSYWGLVLKRTDGALSLTNPSDVVEIQTLNDRLATLHWIKRENLAKMESQLGPAQYLWHPLFGFSAPADASVRSDPSEDFGPLEWTYSEAKISQLSQDLQFQIPNQSPEGFMASRSPIPRDLIFDSKPAPFEFQYPLPGFPTLGDSNSHPYSSEYERFEYSSKSLEVPHGSWSLPPSTHATPKGNHFNKRESPPSIFRRLRLRLAGFLDLIQSLKDSR